MRFGCVMTTGRPASATPERFWWRLASLAPAVLRPAPIRGTEGWAILLPGNAPEFLARAAVRRLQRLGAVTVSVDPAFGVPEVPGQMLHLAAALRAAVNVLGTMERVMVVGAEGVPGRAALSWLAGKARYLSIGDAMGARVERVAERLWWETGVAAACQSLWEPGEPWRGDLLVWAPVSTVGMPVRKTSVRLLARLSRVPLPPGIGSETAIGDGLLAYPPSWPAGWGFPARWRRCWAGSDESTWPERAFPAAGAEALVWAVAGKKPSSLGGARGIEGIWRVATEAGFTLAGWR